VSDILAIIPARGGSKTIPRKNILPILGKPLIGYSIEAAKNAVLVTRAIVSTDDDEIASVARQFGAEVLKRPAELSEDSVPDLPVFEHALSLLKESEGYEPSIVVHLWPTSPYRKDGDIDAAIQLLIEDPEADSVRSVTMPSQTPFKMWRRDKGVYLAPILKKEYPELYERSEPHTLPRQTLPEIVVQTGYVAAMRSSTITEKHSMSGTTIIPFFHDPDTYTELDSLKDLSHTEYVLGRA
jgi:N-acylneuraminate cytidylyltransferase